MSLIVSVTATSTSTSLLRRFDIREDFFQEILGEPHTLLVRRLKTLICSIPRILYDFGLARPGVLAKQHDLCLRFAILHSAYEVTEVIAIHGEDVVEGVEVFMSDLFVNGAVRTFPKDHLLGWDGDGERALTLRAACS